MSIGYLDYIYILWHYVTRICSIHPLKSLKILKDFAINSSTTVKVQANLLFHGLAVKGRGFGHDIGNVMGDVVTL